MGLYGHANDYGGRFRSVIPRPWHRHVDGDDGRHDASGCGPDDHDLYPGSPAPAPAREGRSTNLVFHGRVPCRLGRLRRGRSRGSMGIARQHPDDLGNGPSGSTSRGLPAGCRWGFPVQLSKTSLLEQMPVTHNLPDDGMARRRNRCLYNGSPPWRLLHRLLLGADAAHVRRRSDEPGLDGSACALFPGGETGALAANV